MTFSFLLILDVQCCSPCGFLMLSFSPSPVRRLAPFPSMHVLHLVLDPDPLASHGLASHSVVILALWLLQHSPFTLPHAPLFLQPHPAMPCLVFKCRSSFFLAITPHRLFFLRSSSSILAKANFESTTLQIKLHREPLNSLTLHCSNLQLNTICSFDWILLSPLFSNYAWVSTWSPVVSCSGVVACFTGSSVQQSRPP